MIIYSDSGDDIKQYLKSKVQARTTQEDAERKKALVNSLLPYEILHLNYALC